MADGSELPVGEYAIMPTEEPRKYVIAVKLSTKIINHLQKGNLTQASICFGKENKFVVDNEQYTFSVVQQDETHTQQVQDCYYQSSDFFAEIGGVKKKLLFNQELTGEDRNRIKESSLKAEESLRKHKSIVLSADGKTKGGRGTPKSSSSKRLVPTPKPSRLVVPIPAARTPPPQPPQPQPSTPPTSTSTPPTLSPGTPQQQPVLSPPQTSSSSKVLSPTLSNAPSAPLLPTPSITPSTTPTSTPTPARSKPPASRPTRSAPTPPPQPVPIPKETTPAPPPKVTLRTQLIHDLALRPRTVAKLAELRGNTEEIKGLLPSLAKYKHPPGLWYPKNEMFNEVDTDWFEYSPEDKLEVIEAKKVALEQLAANPPPPVEEKATQNANAIKNLKDIITLDPSERRTKKPRVERPPSSASTTSAPSAAELSPSLSPTLGSPTGESATTKKRARDPTSTPTSNPPSKVPRSIANPPIPPELLSPPPSLPTTAPTSTPPSTSTTPVAKPARPKPPQKPPSASPIPIPTTTPFVTPPPKSSTPSTTKPPKAAPSNPIPTPTKTTPTTKSTPSSKSTTPATTPSPATKTKSNTPPKPGATPSKAAPKSSSTTPSTTPRTSSSSKSSTPVSKSTPTTATTSSKSSADRTPSIPPLRPPSRPPVFNFTITNNADNEKYRKVYTEKYATYLNLHKKLNENREMFLKFDQEWKAADAEARKILSVKIENAYKERRADVERMQDEHGALHAELKAIKDAMKKYVDQARGNATNPNANPSMANSSSKPKQAASSNKAPAQKSSSSQLQSPPQKSSSGDKPAKPTSTSQTPQPPPAPGKQPRRPPPPNKQKPVTTKS